MTTSPSRMTDQVGVRFGLAEGALVAALIAAGLLRLDQSLTLALTATTIVCAGLVLGPVRAAGLAVSGWAMFTGFAENSLGRLTFEQDDVVRLCVLVAVGAGLAWLAAPGERVGA